MYPYPPGQVARGTKFVPRSDQQLLRERIEELDREISARCIAKDMAGAYRALRARRATEDNLAAHVLTKPES